MPTDEALESGLARLPWPSDAGRVGACLGPADLAAYAEGACSPPSRERLEGHLASCSACLAELYDTPRWLDAPPRTVPPSLLRRAQALGSAQRRPPARRWLAAAAALAVACAAIPLLLAPERPSPRVTADRPPLSRPVHRRGEGFARRQVGQPRDNRLTGSLRLTPELRGLLRSRSTDPADHAALLAHLEASRLRVPAASVRRVELAPELRGVAGDAATEVLVTLDAGGTLVLGRVP